MKETRNYSLSLFEKINKIINIEVIDNKALKVLVALILFPITMIFVLVALVIEEPLKCIISLILMKTTFKKVLVYYKKCWSSLIGGMRSGN